MINKGRINKIEEKLNLNKKQIAYEYMIGLAVYKDQSFEESLLQTDGLNNAWSNGIINVLKGKKFIGQFNYAQKPKVAEKLKGIYIKSQIEIKNNPDAGMAILWITLKDGINGEIH